jgi:hypothetical protein
MFVTSCVLYPTSRTFYEVDPADATPQSRDACGYSRNDSAVRFVQGIEIGITVGAIRIQENPDPVLDVGVSFSFPEELTGIAVDPKKVWINVGGDLLQPSSVESRESHNLRIDPQGARFDFKRKPYIWMFNELVYPPPSGLQDNLTFVFQSGALQIDGDDVYVAPFRFYKVTKSDLYYGSINC